MDIFKSHLTGLLDSVFSLMEKAAKHEWCLSDEKQEEQCAYVRLRHDSSPALFVSKGEEHVTCDRLQLLLEQRAKRAKLSNKPALHGFRHAFAINMLCSVVDIFVFLKVMEHFLWLEDRYDVSGMFRLMA